MMDFKLLAIIASLVIMTVMYGISLWANIKKKPMRREGVMIIVFVTLMSAILFGITVGQWTMRNDYNDGQRNAIDGINKFGSQFFYKEAIDGQIEIIKEEKDIE